MLGVIGVKPAVPPRTWYISRELQAAGVQPPSSDPQLQATVDVLWPEITQVILPNLLTQLAGRSVKVHLLRRRAGAADHPLANLSAVYKCSKGFIGVRYPWGDSDNGISAIADLSPSQESVDIESLSRHYNVWTRQVNPARYIMALSEKEKPSAHNRLLDYVPTEI